MIGNSQQNGGPKSIIFTSICRRLGLCQDLSTSRLPNTHSSITFLTMALFMCCYMRTKLQVFHYPLLCYQLPTSLQLLPFNIHCTFSVSSFPLYFPLISPISASCYLPFSSKLSLLYALTLAIEVFH